MTPPSSPADERTPRDPSAIERAALAWVARLDRGLSAAEEAEFERWLAADARHARLLREFEGAWTLLDRVREFPADGLAPAAASTPSSAPAQPPRANFRRWQVAVPAAAAAVLLGMLAWQSRPSLSPSRTPYTAVAGTQVGELRILSLPDGSTIRLNTASSVAVEYTSAVRAIRLDRGEAHFTVAKDSARPFTVTAGSVTVRAVGTAFNVRVHPDAIDVIVTAGRVRLKDDAPSQPSTATPPSSPPSAASTGGAAPSIKRDADHGAFALSAGEAISLPRTAPDAATPIAPRSVSLSPVEIERVLAWREQRLEFVAEPLAVMVAEFNRYNRIKLVIADPALGTQRFGGNFRADDPAGFVRVLAGNFKVVAEQREDEILLRAAP